MTKANYEVTKYKGKWSVYDKQARVYYFTGCGKKFCEQKALELNKME